jgi:sulfoxide reductase heme-binding subunit YedZ
MIRRFKPVVFFACLIPLALLGWKAYNHALGANPIEVITHATGDWILRFLVITLAITPLRKLTGQLWLPRCISSPTSGSINSSTCMRCCTT